MTPGAGSAAADGDPAMIAQALIKTYVLLASLMLASPWLVIAGSYLTQ